MDNSTFLPDLPAAIPPPGVTPNFTDPLSQALILIAVTTTCLSLMVILHLQRMYIKIRKNHRWGWDDCESCKSIQTCPILTAVRLLHNRQGNRPTQELHELLLSYVKLGSIGYAAVCLSSECMLATISLIVN